MEIQCLTCSDWALHQVPAYVFTFEHEMHHGANKPEHLSAGIEFNMIVHAVNLHKYRSKANSSFSGQDFNRHATATVGAHRQATLHPTSL